MRNEDSPEMRNKMVANMLRVLPIALRIPVQHLFFAGYRATGSAVRARPANTP